MPKICLICPPVSGHINAMLAIGLALRKKGWDPHFIGVPDSESFCTPAKIPFRIIGEQDYPKGTAAARSAELGRLRGIRGTLFTRQFLIEDNRLLLSEGFEALKNLQPQAILTDQLCFSGPSIAEVLEIPCITLSAALPMIPDPLIPPAVTGWSHGKGFIRRTRNRWAHSLIERMNSPIRLDLNRFRQHHGLPPLDRLLSCNSSSLHLCQLPQALRYTAKSNLKHILYCGPLQSPDAREKVEFPFDRLDKRPLIYASMGTLQNMDAQVFEMIAEACCTVDCQLVISLGGSQLSNLDNLPGNPLVVPFAPQLELLGRASLCITHGGMNTTMEALAKGVPLLILPVTNDQPAIARILCDSGCALQIPRRSLNARKLREKLRKILSESQFQAKAEKLAQDIQASPGLEGAVSEILREINNHAQRTWH